MNARGTNLTLFLKIFKDNEEIHFFFENLYKGSSNMHEISLRTEKIYENAIGSSGSSTTMKLPALSLCLCPTGRDTSFIVCPTYSNFTSVTLTR